MTLDPKQYITGTLSISVTLLLNPFPSGLYLGHPAHIKGRGLGSVRQWVNMYPAFICEAALIHFPTLNESLARYNSDTKGNSYNSLINLWLTLEETIGELFICELPQQTSYPLIIPPYAPFSYNITKFPLFGHSFNGAHDICSADNCSGLYFV